MSVIDDLLAKRPEERTVHLPLDFQKAHDAAVAEDVLNQARARNQAPGSGPNEAAALEDAQADFDQAVDALRSTSVRFVFRSVSPETFDELKRENRPTEAQRTESKKQGLNPPEWNEATFSPALIAAACILVETPTSTQDGLSVDEAAQLWTADTWNKSERNELFNAAVSAYLNRTRMVEFPKARA